MKFRTIGENPSNTTSGIIANNPEINAEDIIDRMVIEATPVATEECTNDSP